MKVKNAWYPSNISNMLCVETLDGKIMATNVTPIRMVKATEFIPLPGYSRRFNSYRDNRLPDYCMRFYGLEIDLSV